MTSHPNFLRIILGPTGAGKESVALLCAQRLGAQIISVDSMKIYRGLDIGTAKPTASTRACIPHHCIDIAEPTEVFSVADYVRAAEQAIAKVAEQGAPLLSGGTALYYKGLLQGLFDGPGADPRLRASLSLRARIEGAQALHAELTRLDPVTASRVHANDLRRVIRALEVIKLTGKPISEQQTQWPTSSPLAAPQKEPPAPTGKTNPENTFDHSLRYPCSMVALQWPRGKLHRRIESRVERMMAAGLLDEARLVYERRREFSHTPLQAVGYKEFFPHFEGNGSLEESVEQVKQNSRKLAKSQDTWFRKFPCKKVHMDENRPLEEVTREVLAAWENNPQKQRRILA